MCGGDRESWGQKGIYRGSAVNRSGIHSRTPPQGGELRAEL